MKNFLWGIEIGEHSIDGIIISAEKHPEIVSRVRLESYAEHGYDHILSRVATTVKMLESEVGRQPDLLGIAIPGLIDPTSSLIKQSSLACLNDRRLQDDIERQTKLRCSLAHHATCFALAEALFGAAVKCRCVFGALIDQEVNGGVVYEGTALIGAHGLAGGWGKTHIVSGNSAASATVNDLISQKSLCDFYSLKTGDPLALHEIFKRYIVGGDSAALETINRLLVSFGRALALVVTILDPDVIVVGGSVSDIDPLFTQGVEEAAQFISGEPFRTRIVKAHYADTAVVLGAALLGNQPTRTTRQSHLIAL